MVKRVKHRIIFAVPALLAFLAAAWVLGNLLLDVQLAGHNEDRKETPLPAPAGVVVAFGTEAHATPEQWKDVKQYWALLRIAKKLPGTSRLLWK